MILDIDFGCSISNLLINQIDALLPTGPQGQTRRRIGLSQICDKYICLSFETLSPLLLKLIHLAFIHKINTINRSESFSMLLS